LVLTLLAPNSLPCADGAVKNLLTHSPYGWMRTSSSICSRTTEATLCSKSLAMARSLSRISSVFRGGWIFSTTLLIDFETVVGHVCQLVGWCWRRTKSYMRRVESSKVTRSEFFELREIRPSGVLLLFEKLHCSSLSILEVIDSNTLVILSRDWLNSLDWDLSDLTGTVRDLD